MKISRRHAWCALSGIALLLIAVMIMPAAKQQRPYQPLWPGGAPDARGNQPEDAPAIKIFPAPAGKATKTAVVIFPGGAYKRVEDSFEGAAIAQWLNSVGVTAVVLRYRVTPNYFYPVPLNDALRAIRYVRYHAYDLGIAPNQIGVMGFSAGGHLASLAATHYAEAELVTSDPVDGVGSRPDFLLLGYPIITMLPPYTHEASAVNLLGPDPSEKARREVSSELHVDENTPPAFIFHGGADMGVPSENSVLFYMALRKAGVPAELHIFEKGKHGVGLANGRDSTPNDPVFAVWQPLAVNWMAGRGLLARP